MLQFDIDNRKTITFSLDVEGSSAESLRYMLRLIFESVEYGFKGVYQKEGAANIVRFNIPPLATIGDFSTNEFKVKLEIIGDKFFASPWEDKGEFLPQPSVSSKLISSSENKTRSTPKRENFSEDGPLIDKKVEEARRFLKQSSNRMKVGGKVSRLSSLLSSSSQLSEDVSTVSKKSHTRQRGAEAPKDEALGLLKGLDLMKGTKMND